MDKKIGGETNLIDLTDAREWLVTCLCITKKPGQVGLRITDRTDVVRFLLVIPHLEPD
jgi:hypothetical protein